MAATVDYLFGYGATTNLIKGIHFQEVARASCWIPNKKGSFSATTPLPWKRPLNDCWKRLSGVYGRVRTRIRLRRSNQTCSNSKANSNDFLPFHRHRRNGRPKKSLIYHAIDPRIGGTLLLGHRGCAKSTLVRSFSEVLRSISATTTPFVEVPLGTTEDRLLGSVNAEELVENRKWSGRIGLLEEAHGGVLYIDEINCYPTIWRITFSIRQPWPISDGARWVYPIRRKSVYPGRDDEPG